jgi:serine/threonine-protein kinase
VDDEQREQLRQRLQNGIGDAYELQDMIGKGGMGVVFRARERSLDRVVALKVLAFDPLLVPEAFTRFEREAKLAARLDHPHIVPIFAVGQGRGIAFYTMRYVRGGSLEDQLSGGRRVEMPRALRYLREIATALDYAHSQGIVHRDIKPANVMLGDDDHVFVADFGIARAVGGDGTQLTTSGVVGSPAYMAPEQWQGQPIDGRADQYAIGILAYELLTGKRPYRDATMHELLRLHLTEELPDITRDLPNAPPALHDILRRATAKDPATRFESIGAFIAALEDAAAQPAGAARAPARSAVVRASAGRVSAAPAPASAPLRATVPSAAPATERRSRVLPVGIGLVIVTFAAIQFAQSRRIAAVAPPPLPDTVFVQGAAAPPDTVFVRPAAPAPETVRVAVPTAFSADSGRSLLAPGATNPGATLSAAAGTPASSSTVATLGYIGILAIGNPRGQLIVDGQPRRIATPHKFPVAPGRHVVSFRGPFPSYPDSVVLNVNAGDTAVAFFVPARGGGAQGDLLRQQALDRARRANARGGQAIPPTGRGRGAPPANRPPPTQQQVRPPKPPS